MRPGDLAGYWREALVLLALVVIAVICKDDLVCLSSPFPDQPCSRLEAIARLVVRATLWLQRSHDLP
jgi:hypothetical protein